MPKSHNKLVFLSPCAVMPMCDPLWVNLDVADGVKSRIIATKTMCYLSERSEFNKAFVIIVFCVLSQKLIAQITYQ